MTEQGDLEVWRAALDRSCLDGDAGGAAAAVSALLDEQGYAHVCRAIGQELFEGICRALGEVVLRTDLQVDMNRSSPALRPEPLDFHNDSPLIDLIAWYCVRQDAEGGATLLLDLRDLADHLAPPELAALATVPVRYPDLERHDPDHGRFAYLDEPLLRATPRGWRIYYAPWLLTEPRCHEERSALDRLAECVARKERAGPISVRLQSGECSFVDNHRMLHGRKALAPQSQRLLKRAWIRRAALAAGSAPGGG